MDTFSKGFEKRRSIQPLESANANMGYFWSKSYSFDPLKGQWSSPRRVMWSFWWSNIQPTIWITKLNRPTPNKQVWSSNKQLSGENPPICSVTSLAMQCTNIQCWRLADDWTLGWVDYRSGSLVPDLNYARSGWQKLRERGSGAPRKVRVFYERKDLQHTLFCRET